MLSIIILVLFMFLFIFLKIEKAKANSLEININISNSNISSSKKTGSNNRNYYVYVHKDNKNKIFYIGKGTGKRAWKEDSRHDLWQYYVDEYLKGEYKVEILVDNLKEEEAFEKESKLIKKYGKQIVNWVNFGRDIDYEVYNKYIKLKKENEKYIEKTKNIEKENLEKATERYIKAYKNFKKYYNMKIEKRNCLVLKLADEYFQDTGNFYLIDRLSLCLKKLEKYKELIFYIEQYLKDFPGVKNLKKWEKVWKRKEYAEEKINSG